MAQTWPRLRGEAFVDLLFIDGDHTTEGVKRDFDLAKRLVRVGGLIVFDDLERPEVEEAWAAICSDNAMRFIGTYTEGFGRDRCLLVCLVV